jgi:hypothetical protein
MIGQEKYCFDAKTKKIFTGIVIATNLSTTGYTLARVITKNNETKMLELAHIHNTEEQCKEHAKKVTPFIEQAEKINKEATEKVNELRIKVIDQPNYTELAKRLE